MRGVVELVGVMVVGCGESNVVVIVYGVGVGVVMGTMGDGIEVK